MSQHAVLAPSSAPQWRFCAASVLLQAMFPELEESEEQREGTAAHWVGDAMIRSGVRAGAVPIPAEGDQAPNGVTVTREILDGARLYADDVLSVCRKHDVFGGDQLLIEERVGCTGIHVEVWGTPDCGLYSRDALRVYVWDFKFGHRRVEAFENWQLLCYIEGLLRRWGVTGIGHDVLWVCLRVVQPRSFHPDGPVREWWVKASDLRPYWNDLATAAEAAMQTNAVATTGPQCRDCRARHACDAFTAASMAWASFASQRGVLEHDNHSVGVELRIIRRAIEELRARETGLEELALSMVRDGKSVPHFRPVQGYGREKWDVPAAEVLALGKLYGTDLQRPPAPITPNQARDAGIPAELVNSYSIRPPGSLRLEADNGSKARQIFGGSSTEEPHQ